ncbi:MAG: hypothetical protein M1823_000982 [Watsoniomyces obsoletus]|nr:MAG: hypothetical protein M1823_000982 [Watsoniomyces obsoletus]
MRLLFLPITTRRALIYCQRLNIVAAETPRLLDRITARAARTWAQWERGPKRWQQLIVENGNKALRRIPYEEWGLKSIPPISARTLSVQPHEGKSERPSTVEVAFPASFLRPDRVMAALQKLAIERQSFHRKWLWWSVIGMPITIPIALIPIMVTLARLMSGSETALSGSKHLDFLLQQRLIVPSPSTLLDRVYESRLKEITADSSTSGAPPSTSPSDDESSLAGHLEKPGHTETFLLQKTDGREAAEALNLPELAVEIERAVEQVEQSLRMAAPRQ